MIKNKKNKGLIFLEYISFFKNNSFKSTNEKFVENILLK